MTPRPFGFLLPLALPALVVVGAQVGGSANLLVPLFVFGLLPIADHLVGPDRWNPDPIEERTLAEAKWYSAILVLYTVAHFGLLAFAVGHAPAIGGVERALFAVAIGVVTGGIGITVAHELGHKRGAWERAGAWWLLASVGYTHFGIEHNRGHHGRVATPEDPASARFGEGFWAFLPRTLWGSLASAWSFDRLGVLRGSAATAALFTLAWWFGGRAALGVLGVQAIVAITLLEAVNYIEHYGLERARHPQGGWARVETCHSWNASHRLTNWFLFNLQRHSHHHVDHSRRYQTLHHLPESPQLPTGYAGMVLLALVPSLWHAVMDPRAAAYRAATPAAAGVA
jgi:alkane 1-monooxygenase